MKPEEKVIHNGHLRYQELLDFVNAFPALLWRIDLVDNRIEYLNHHRIEPLGADSGLLLQNKAFGRKYVCQEDLYLLDDFLQAVRTGETAATVFRLKIGEDAVKWIKVTGVVDPKNPRYYLGYMLDASHTAGIIESIVESDAEMEAMIELIDAPALLVDPRTRAILAHNAAAREVFLFRPDEFTGLHFSDLYHKSAESQIRHIHEMLIFEKRWEGHLVFQRKNRSVFSANVRMRLFYFKGRRVFRVSIHDLVAEDETLKNISGAGVGRNATASPYRPQSRQLLSKVEKVKDVNRLLHILLENQVGEDRFDAIIFSDIYAKRNKVVVYTAGEPFAPLPQGEVFSYEGTIAENIDRFKLEHLIVDDTFASIKAIDWALFIPHGIRSYFAKAFYERNAMRSVLILCSVNRGFFSTHRLEEYAAYYDPFLKGLKNWRREQRARKGHKRS